MEDRLRLLARWQARRRDVDELLGPLLAHGPAAVDRVTLKLAEVTQAIEAEREAYDLFETAAAQALALEPAPRATRPVDELAVARRRALRSRLGTSGELRDSSPADTRTLLPDGGGYPPVLEIIAPRAAVEDQAP
ncbi:MAG: hypothetical protein JWL64_2852 [Frankiales bacterium]|nr:hypothetical protein [Frankiales bacterium]